MVQLNKGDKVYYARIMPKIGVYEVYDLTVRTVTDTWFVGIDKKDKRAFLLDIDSIGEIVFFDRRDAVNEAKEAEKKYPKFVDVSEDY